MDAYDEVHKLELPMDYSEIKGRIESLRGELTEVAEHNRQYFSRKNHSADEGAQHRQLQDRVHQIRSELYALFERTKAA